MVLLSIHIYFINKYNSESSFFSAFLYLAGYWGWGAVTTFISQSQLGKLSLCAATTEGAPWQSCCYLHNLWQRPFIFYGLVITEENTIDSLKCLNSITDLRRLVYFFFPVRKYTFSSFFGSVNMSISKLSLSLCLEFMPQCILSDFTVKI